ncbi:MAG: response regulator [Alphaproteobacteria bacterium]|nr:response regulator [Alphaproteobacteria bacterium]
MAESKQMRSPIKILIVEDSDLLRGIFKTALSAEHLIEGAATVKEGWEMFLEYAPNIVFLDITLPDGSGHDLAYRIKTRAPKTYIVMATASDYTDDKEEAAFNRADGYLTKPFGKHEIDSVIERYWSSRT